MEENDMSRRMPGAMPDIEGEPGKLHLVAILQPAVRTKGAEGAETVFGGLVGQGLDEKEVVFMRPLDGDTEFPGEVSCGRGMVEMTMRQQDLLDCDPQFRGSLLDTVEISAGIADRSAHVVVVPEQRAVLLEGRDGKNSGLESHDRKTFVL